MGGGGDCSVEYEFVSHYLLALHEVNELLYCVDLRNKIYHFLAPFHKATPHCLGAVDNPMIFIFPLDFAVGFSLRPEHVLHVILEVIVQIVGLVDD